MSFVMVAADPVTVDRETTWLGQEVRACCSEVSLFCGRGRVFTQEFPPGLPGLIAAISVSPARWELGPGTAEEVGCRGRGAQRAHGPETAEETRMSQWAVRRGTRGRPGTVGWKRPRGATCTRNRRKEVVAAWRMPWGAEALGGWAGAGVQVGRWGRGGSCRHWNCVRWFGQRVHRWLLHPSGCLERCQGQGQLRGGAVRGRWWECLWLSRRVVHRARPRPPLCSRSCPGDGRSRAPGLHLGHRCVWTLGLCQPPVGPVCLLVSCGLPVPYASPLVRPGPCHLPEPSRPGLSPGASDSQQGPPASPCRTQWL